MPANRMKAEVGSTLKVIGSSSAMVSAGPKPGSTPIAVPSVVPTRHHIRLIGVSATAKPLINCAKASISLARHSEQAFQEVFDDTGADIDSQRLGKTEIGDECKSCADQRIARDAPGAEPARHAYKQNDGREREPSRPDQQNIQHQPCRHPSQCRVIGRDFLFLFRLPASAY